MALSIQWTATETNGTGEERVVTRSTEGYGTVESELMKMVLRGAMELAKKERGKLVKVSDVIVKLPKEFSPKQFPELLWK